MVSNVTFWLALLSALHVGAAIGFMLGCMGRVANVHDEALGEHQCDVHHPRIGD